MSCFNLINYNKGRKIPLAGEGQVFRITEMHFGSTWKEEPGVYFEIEFLREDRDDVKIKLVQSLEGKGCWKYTKRLFASVGIDLVTLPNQVILNAATDRIGLCDVEDIFDEDGAPDILVKFRPRPKSKKKRKSRMNNDKYTI